MTTSFVRDETQLTDGKRTLDMAAGRRAFIRSMGLTAAGAALLGSGMGLLASEAQAAGITDADILNFALNLEYLEAEFYLRGAFGRGLAMADTTGTGKLGVVKGGKLVPFKTPVIKGYAQEIASDEEHHVKFIRSALGSTAVARPAIDLVGSFNKAAHAAGLTGGTGLSSGQTFDAFASEDNFLLAAFIFEDVGVTAYKGAAALISDKAILTAAAGLLAVEAYHAGEIRTLLVGKGFFDAAQKISDLRDAVDGSTDDDQGIGTATAPNVVPTDANGLAFSRTPDQVLNIVYLGGAANGFGFYPSKMNGNVK